MKQSILNFIVRLKDNKWIYIVAALVLVIIILVLIIVIPSLRSRVDVRADEGCDLALRTTNELLAYEAIDMTPEEAQAFVDKYGSFCPGGGRFYAIEIPGHEGAYTAVCGLHDTDTLRRAELNGKDAMAQVKAALDKAQSNYELPPDAVTVHLNSEDFNAVRLTAEPKITHGTRSTAGFSGTFICYITDEDGALTFFCYADRDHCFRWRAGYGPVPEDVA